MNAIAAQPAAPSSRARHFAVALLAGAFAFWPAFMLLTLLEERAGFLWLRTENQKIWLPIAGLALLSAIGAPLFLNLSVPKKVAASLSSLLGFFIIYWLVVVTGVSFLNWGD